MAILSKICDFSICDYYSIIRDFTAFIDHVKSWEQRIQMLHYFKNLLILQTFTLLSDKTEMWTSKEEPQERKEKSSIFVACSTCFQICRDFVLFILPKLS